MSLLEESKQLTKDYSDILIREKQLLKNFKGHWKISAFGHYLTPPNNAKLAILSFATPNTSLLPVNRCLAHQIYLHDVLEIIETKNARHVCVDYIGSHLNDNESTVTIWSLKNICKEGNSDG